METHDPWGWPAFLTALAAALCSLLTGGVAAWRVWADWRARDARQQVRDRDRLIDRHTREIEALQAEVARRVAADLACREEVAELRGRVTADFETMRRWGSLLARWHDALDKAGIPVEDSPALPDPPPFRAQRAATAEADFEARQRQQAAGLLKAETERVRHPEGRQ